MIYFTNKKTLQVYGYISIAEAVVYSEYFEDLIEMSDELFQEYITQPTGYKWSLAGWIEDEELMKALKAQNESQKQEEIKSRIAKLENDLIIANLRGKDITEILKQLDEAEAELK